MKHEDYTVGWISALPTEMAAAQGMLDAEHQNLYYQNDSNQYTLGKIGEHNVVLACLPDGVYGTTSAAIVAKEMQRTFPSVRIGLMVGIGGGVPKLPDRDIRLGDVVVGKPTDTNGGVIQYDLGKAIQGGQFKRVGSLNRPPTVLLTAVATLRAKHLMKGDEILKYVLEMIKKYPKMRDHYAYQGTQHDQLFEASYDHGDGSTCAKCDTGRLIHRVPPARDRPSIHYGLIASGNQVIKDAKTRDLLRNRLSDEQDGEIFCFEMEAAGLMNSFPCLVIRGICDYADTHKNKDWQHRAAATAAAYAKELLYVIASSQVVSTQKAQETTATDSMPSKYKALKQDLYSTNPQDDLAALRRRLGKRVEGTCEWILDRPEFYHWLRSPGIQLLRLVGEPGIGKSMISSFLAEELEKCQKTENAIFVYYFFDNKERNRRTALMLLRTLLLQLLQQEPDLFQVIEADYQQMGEKLKESFDALWRILISMLERLQTRCVWILIDAVDECDQGRTDLLQSLRNRIIQASPEKKPRFKFLLTCRPEADIQDLLNGVGQELQIDKGTIIKDLEHFIKIRVDEISSLRPAWNAQKIKDALNLKTGGTFLWVALVLQELMLPGKTLTMKQVQRKLEDMPTDLRKIYDRILRDIDKEHVEDVVKLLQCVVAASRPLRVAELTEAHAFMMPEWPKNQAELKGAANDLADSHKLCGCLLFIDAQDNTVNLIHQSAKDYLLSSYLDQHQELDFYHVVQENVNLFMFESCWRCLSLSDLDDFFTYLPSTCEYGQDYSGIPDSGAIEFLNYAAGQWVRHALAASRTIHKSYIWGRSYLSNRPHLRDRWLGEVSANGYEVVVRLLLDGGAQVGAKDKSGRTALHWAASSGHKGVVKLLLEHKTDVDAKDEDGWTALHWGATKGHNVVVQLLLENGANLEAADKAGMTALMLAAQDGQQATVAVLLEKGAYIEAEDKYGTALIRASKGGHEAVVLFLLEKGAKSSVLDQICRKTALHWAAERGHENISELLVSHGGFLDAPDAFGETALHYAAGNGHELVVKALLRNMPNVLLEDKKRRTPRRYAEQNGHTNVAQILKEYIGDVLDLHTTEKGGRAELIEAARLGQETKVRQLVEKGANLEAEDEYRRTALITAASGGHKMTVELLIEKGAEIEARDINGMTALMYAAQGHKVVLQLLLEKEAEIRATDNDGQTALHWAARYGHETIVGLLLKRGAVLDATSRDGTALSWAADGGHDAVVRLLLKNYANLEMKGGGKFGGGTPLSLAAAWGHESIVLQLLESGAELYAKGEYEQTALDRAREGGFKAVVKILEGWSEHRSA